MEVLSGNSSLTLLEPANSGEGFQKLLESQKALFDNQVDWLREIVVTQCKLTGINPLSQEMAAGALSIKIGKRPRDLLNPKAVKYMEDMFSVKDAISKKESREISALFGVTVTQVRDFFASQRMRVRKLSRISREKVVRSTAVKGSVDDIPINAESIVSIDPIPLNSIAPAAGEELNCFVQNDMLPGLDELDKQFVDNIFKLMSKEETFSGQLKLMDWIRRIQNPSVLSWFLTKGGMMIIATWLSQAAIEEQTDVLCGFLEVLAHLPINDALRCHVAAIIQEVNRLRFYRASDVSNRAQTLLTKWSKTLLRTQGMKKINGVEVSGKQKQRTLKSSGEIITTEPWQSDINLPEELLTSSYDGPDLENNRKLDGPTLKLLPALADDLNRKHILGASSSQNRKRRKVQLVEHPGQKSAGRSPQSSKVTAVNQSRPMSADDIQKAKIRALHMQNKYRKAGSATNEKNDVKTEVASKTITVSSIPSSMGQVQPVVDERDNVDPSKSTPEVEISATKGCKGVNSLAGRRTLRIPWKIPAEVKLSDEWRVGCGEESKEVDFQKNRNKREKETFYNSVQEIPLNPKEPWDREMDYDDTLTPVIPTEQLPDAEEAGPQVSSAINGSALLTASAPSTQNVEPMVVEPDYELLAVLLKTPALVFTLKEELEGRSMTQQTVKILDMIRAGEINIQGDLKSNGVGGVSVSSGGGGGGGGGGDGGGGMGVRENVAVSLPSPTPSSDPVPGTGGSVTDAARNPFSRHGISGYPAQGVATNKVAAQQPTTGFGGGVPAPAQVPANAMTIQQLSANMQALAQLMQDGLASSSSNLANKPPNFVHEQLQHHHSHHSPHNALQSNSTILQPQPELVQQPIRNSPITASAYHNRPMATANVTERPNSVYPSLVTSQQPYLQQPQQLPTQPFCTPGSVLNASREGFGVHHQDAYSRVNQTSYKPYSAGKEMVQPQWGSSAAPLDRDRRNDRGQFESWSPENSPSRNPDYRAASRSSLEPRLGPDRLYAGPERSRRPASSGYPTEDYHSQGSRWQRDRRY